MSRADVLETLVLAGLGHIAIAAYGSAWGRSFLWTALAHRPAPDGREASASLSRVLLEYCDDELSGAQLVHLVEEMSSIEPRRRLPPP